MLSEASQVAMWIMLIIHSIIVFILVRQVKTGSNGIAPGISIPSIKVHNSEGHQVSLDHLVKDKNVTLLCVISPNCRFCKEVVFEINKIYLNNANFAIKLLVVGDGEGFNKYVVTTNVAIEMYSISYQDCRRKLRTSSYPFGMVIDNQGVIMRRGIIKKENILSWLVDVPKLLDSFSNKRRGAI